MSTIHENSKPQGRNRGFWEGIETGSMLPEFWRTAPAMTSTLMDLSRTDCPFYVENDRIVSLKLSI